MAAHIGIELSPGVCRILEIEVPRARAGVESGRVSRFSTYAIGSRELDEALARLRGRSAAVVVWGAPADHRQVMVTAGSYDTMRREARRALALAGLEIRSTMLDIAPAPAPAADSDWRRPVIAALASGAAVRAGVEPISAAGIRIGMLATPAIALASLARMRRARLPEAVPPPGRPENGANSGRVTVDAWIAVRESAMCIALLRDGALVAARELAFGYQSGRRGESRRPEDVAARLADELAEFMISAGGSTESVRRIMLCGGAPTLGAIAASLHLATDVEVDARDFCLAWAVAIDRRAPLSLVHARRREMTRMRWAQAAIAAGVFIGVAVGYEAARHSWLPELAASTPVVREVPLFRRSSIESSSGMKTIEVWFG